MADKNILYSTKNSNLLCQPVWEGSPEEGIHINSCCCATETNNLVKQLYFNKNFKKKKCKIMDRDFPVGICNGAKYYSGDELSRI